jgi:hypothetical protein
MGCQGLKNSLFNVKSTIMKKFYLSCLATVLSLAAQAHSFVDEKLQKFVRNTIIEAVKPYGNDVPEASCVIMRPSGEVLVDVGLGFNRKKVKDIPSLNSESVAPGIVRLVLYLSLMDENLQPDYVINTGSGEYCDSSTNCVIRDMSYSRGGWQDVTIQKAVDVSNIGVYKAVEKVFKRNMGTYGRSLIRTGITFNTEDNEPHANSLWLPCDIMGAHSPYTMYQQLMWLSGTILNNGKIVLRLSPEDSSDPVCEVKSSKRAIDRLREAMIMTVETGTGRLLKTSGVTVAAALNVSEPDLINCRTLTGFLTLSSDCQAAGGYCIGVYVKKHDLPAGRKLPALILKQIVDYMISKGYVIVGNNSASYNETIKHSDNWVHPAQR